METKHPGNERMQGRRRGNVLNYEGNICKQVIEALGRRLDKWRTVLLLFKRVTPTCEWIFCSQKVARVSQHFHSRGRRLSFQPFEITIETVLEAEDREWSVLPEIGEKGKRCKYDKNCRFDSIRTRRSKHLRRCHEGFYENGISRIYIAEWKRSTRSSCSVPV